MKQFNLIVTCGRLTEFNALRELESIFYMLGDEKARFRKSVVRGILLGYTHIDPHIAIKKIRKLIIERPWDFRFTRRYIPIDIVVKTSLEDIKNAVAKLIDRIPRDNLYRITVEKRYTYLHTKEVIDAIAPLVDRDVSLKNPDYILLIEIIGDFTGVSVVKPEEILSVEKELLSHQ